MTSYKYDFELSSKQKTFLWLYQVLPNVDVINEIYKLKDELEDEDVRIQHGLLSPTVIIINDNNIQDIFNPQKLNTMLIKLIVDEGFMCSFFYNEFNYTTIELEEINVGNWFSVVRNINLHPPLKDKLKIVNILYNSIPLLITDVYDKLYKIYLYYLNNDNNGYFRLGIDQNDKIYFPLLYV